jgi:23S rRNA pseudouridine2604 synthase
MDNQGIQINKYISNTGYCSRREADKLIAECRVMINDSIALPSSKVHEHDKVFVDDEILKRKKSSAVYLMFNKPIGLTTTTDLTDKTNVISFINYPKRIFPIGRLDKDSEGLLLLTDDGDIVNKILRAGNQHDKEYIVTVNKGITPEFITKMSRGLPILGTQTLPCKVHQISGKKFSITLTQGLNRQIRRMCDFLGYDVTSLTRVRIMNIKLDKLPTGKWRLLNTNEIAELHNRLANSSKTEK